MKRLIAMKDYVEFLKRIADSTNAGSASYKLTYPDGSTLEIIYKPKK